MQILLLDDQILPELHVAPSGLTEFLLPSTNLPLQNKARMLFFPTEFGELNIDGLIDTGAFSSAIPEANLRKIRLLVAQTKLNEGLIIVSKYGCQWKLEAPIATIELQSQVGDFTFREKFLVITNLTSHLVGLLFLHRNNSVLGMRRKTLTFPFFLVQFKNEERTCFNVIESIINPLENILQVGKKTISVKSEIHSHKEATGITQVSLFPENIHDLLFCPAISTTEKSNHMVKISNFLNHP